jgi:carboxymethylenebutenolidase
MGSVSFPAPGGELKGYVSEPIGAGPWPGVIVIMDLFGLGDDIRDQTDRLAAAGFLAFAPDLYSGRGVKCVIATLKASRSGTGRAYEEIEAARQWLIDRSDCTGRTGIIGFCMGGGFALMLAPSGGYRAASVNYGEVPQDAATRLVGACPVIGSYGGEDRSMPGRASRLEGVLGDLGIPHDVKEYPDAGHSFLNRFNTGPVLGQFISLLGVGYHHDSAQDAWRRIFTFFDAHLLTQDQAVDSLSSE